MSIKPRYISDPDFTFDILRGLAQYTGSRFVRDLAEAVVRHPFHNISQALGHRQIACKTWLRDELVNAFGGTYGTVWVVGGWYGVLPAMLFDDARYRIGSIVSFDTDADCAAVARAVNRGPFDEGRFKALTGDMYELAYDGPGAPDLVINTSCEHIADVGRWLERLPAGMATVLQSNDYFDEPEHINCVNTLEEFVEQAGLSKISFRGVLETKKYDRFMLIGNR